MTIDSPERSITINGSIFNAKKLKQELIIEIPKQELKYLSIDTSNGNISADHLEVQKGKIDTSNGNIYVNWLYTNRVVDIMSMKKRGRLSRTSLV